MLLCTEGMRADSVRVERRGSADPFFINEAAYYEKGVAFMVGHRSQQPVHVLVNASGSKRQKTSA